MLEQHFSVAGQVAIVTGGSGAIGRVMAGALAGAGARVAIVGRRAEPCAAAAEEIARAGGKAVASPADVLDGAALARVRDDVVARWGTIDILVNAAGGNLPEATTSGNQSFFDLPPDAFNRVFDLNLTGTVLPCQVFGLAMAERSDGPPKGCIVNISSMAAQRPLTRVAGYSAAKSAVDSFTRWLAVDLARRFGPGMRVNAIAPGFFLGEQNRAMLITPEGELTERGRQIVEHTPAGRFGATAELASTLLWLCGPGASFVNGIVVPVDGGFSAYPGV